MNATGSIDGPGPAAGTINSSTAIEPAPLYAMDVATTVMAIRAATRRDRIGEATSDARSAEVDRRGQVQARLDAMRRAEAARKEGSFWSDVAHIAKRVALVAAVVVGAVATVYTAGTSGLLAAVAVAALTAAPAALPELANRAADALGANGTGRLVLQGLALAGCIALAVFNPAGAVSAATQTTGAMSETAQTVARVGDVIEATGRLVGAHAEVVRGVALVDQGLATIERGADLADANRHEARSVAITQRRDEAMEQLEDEYREAARAARVFAQMVGNQDQASQAALRA